MDEATAALDENIENILYTRIRKELKESIIISVGHRSSIKSFHNIFLEWQEDFHWKIQSNSQYVEDGDFSESPKNDTDVVTRYRNAYNYKNSSKKHPWYKRFFKRKD